MIELATPTREQTLAQLLQWLPGVYRGRDSKGQLAAFLSLLSDELWRRRMLLEQQGRDFFIDSAQNWVLPYLADLVGAEVPYTGAAAQMREITRRNRDDVLNTLRWRRQKGTLGGLQDVAQHVGGSGSHAVEMFERCAWLQNLNHCKPAAVFALDLADGEALARAATAFSTARRFADLRQADHRIGRVRPRNVAIFTWPIASYPLREATPFALGGGRFRFDPLGADTPLMAGCASEAERAAVLVPVPAGDDAGCADIAHLNSNDLPIRRRDLAAHAAAYVGTTLGFAIREDGISLVGGAAPASPSLAAATDFVQLAQLRGLLAADTTAYAAGTQLELAAARLGAVTHLVEGVTTHVPYSPGQTWATQFQMATPGGRLRLDNVTPDFSYAPGVLPYQPDSGEFHRPPLLLALTNLGAATVNVPMHEVILRNTRGIALQAALPATVLASGATMFWYVADDGSTYYARGDHLAGTPDRNPDSAVFGAFSAAHLARASEGQRRIRSGHPAGAARFRHVVARDLCCWDKPLVPALAAGEVAIDAERGRFAFAAGEAPAGELTVDFRFARTAAIGAGPFAGDAPPDLPAVALTVARSRDADFATVQAALNAAPDALAVPVVIEILDSTVYEEALQLANRAFPGGLVLRAAPLQSPVLRKPAPAADLLRVTDTAASQLRFSGLVCTGGNIEISGAASAVAALALKQCTLEPATVALTVNQATPIALDLATSIVGALSVTAPDGQLHATDTILQHPAATVEQPAAGTALAFANGALDLERVTLIGSCAAVGGRLSNTLLLGALALADLDTSCLRYSRLPAPLPARAFQCTTATPIFVALHLGAGGYCHLHPLSSAQLTGGGEEAGEIGALAAAGLPWRMQAVTRRIEEYLPAGLAQVAVPVLPRPRFLGVRPL